MCNRETVIGRVLMHFEDRRQGAGSGLVEFATSLFPLNSVVLVGGDTYVDAALPGRLVLSERFSCDGTELKDLRLDFERIFEMLFLISLLFTRG